jgi:hypothetical protein
MFLTKENIMLLFGGGIFTLLVWQNVSGSGGKSKPEKSGMFTSRKK